MTVKESSSIKLDCTIFSQSSPDSRFSVFWYVERSDDEDVEDQLSEDDDNRDCVFSIGHDAIFGNGNCSPPDDNGPNSRFQFERTTSDQYSLTIHGARPADSGRYFCHVEEWLLNPRNEWYRLATNNSGITVVSVLQKGKPQNPQNLCVLICGSVQSGKLFYGPECSGESFHHHLDFHSEGRVVTHLHTRAARIML